MYRKNGKKLRNTVIERINAIADSASKHKIDDYMDRCDKIEQRYKVGEIAAKSISYNEFG